MTRSCNGNTRLAWPARFPEFAHDAQILVACGITTPEELAATPADSLWEKVGPFAESVEGKRIVRGNNPPDLEEVCDWVRGAKQARALHAA